MSTFNTIMAVIFRTTIAKYTILLIKLKKWNDVKIWFKNIRYVTY